MQPEHLIFGGGTTDTILHPIVAVWMLIAAVLILVLPRNKAIVPFLLAFFMIPLGQIVVVGGIHFPVLRILIIVGLVRIALPQGSSRESSFAGGFNPLDQAVVLWTLSSLVVISLQWMELQPFVKFVGDFLDSLGGYLVARFLIPDRDAVWRTARVLAVICLIQGAFMVSEQFTHRNVLDFLGATEPSLREGHVRSEGVMGTLYGGVFAGVLIPLFLWLWTDGRFRVAALLGIVGSTTMVWASHASTSWMAYGAGLFGLSFWLLRRRMRIIRWGIVAALVGLHLVMHGPVWSLIEKIDVTGGSSNYHRYMLVDNCIRHFGDWWLLGYKQYGDWGWDMWDLCNQFVAVALTGGLVSLVLYILIFKRGFGAIGTARRQVEGNHKEEWFLWSLGAVLFAIVVSSFGINYMIQLQIFMFSVLACVSVAAFAKHPQSQTCAALDQMQSLSKLDKHGIHPSLGIGRKKGLGVSSSGKEEHFA